MQPLHILLAVGVMAAWGFNFVVIKIGLETFPPLLLSALRFSLAGLPLIFIWRTRPAPLKWICAIALSLAIFKFSFLFIGMNLGAQPGLSSLTLQSQAFFTVLLAFFLLAERPTKRQLGGMTLAVFGLGLIITDIATSHGTLVGLSFVILSALCWGFANLAMKKAQSTNPLHLMVWVSALSGPILFGLSLAFEDLPDGSAPPLAWASVFYLAFIATLGGFGVWAFLLKRYSATQVAPFSLLVPIFGMSSSAWLTGETISTQVLIAALFILCGLYLTSISPNAFKVRKAEC